MARIRRLTRGDNFRRLLQEGKRLRAGEPTGLILSMLPNGLSYRRFGCLIRREAAPKAVVRNRLKRWLREAYRRNEKEFPSGVDLLAVISRPPANPSFQKIQEALKQLSHRLV